MGFKTRTTTPDALDQIADHESRAAAFFIETQLDILPRVSAKPRRAVFVRGACSQCPRTVRDRGPLPLRDSLCVVCALGGRRDRPAVLCRRLMLPASWIEEFVGSFDGLATRKAYRDAHKLGVAMAQAILPQGENAPGAIVEVAWLGSNTGTESKRARIVRVDEANGRVGVNVAKTAPDGSYTGHWGTEVRWFPMSEIVSREAL